MTQTGDVITLKVGELGGLLVHVQRAIADDLERQARLSDPPDDFLLRAAAVVRRVQITVSDQPVRVIAQ